jgi:hypothetical protein
MLTMLVLAGASVWGWQVMNRPGAGAVYRHARPVARYALLKQKTAE